MRRTNLYCYSKESSGPFEDARTDRGFTLIELLVVLAIVGVLAAITLPNLGSFKSNNAAAGTRQLLDDVAKARQLAIAQHTTVYMVFVPPSFWTNNGYPNLPKPEQAMCEKLLDKQLTGYALLTTRSVGDQPGSRSAAYLSGWKTLPEGIFIPPEKFSSPDQFVNIYTNDPSGIKVLALRITGFNTTDAIPFPSPDAPLTRFSLPYIAFDHAGRLAADSEELIPLAKGSILFRRDPVNGDGVKELPSIQETPAGNFTKAFNVVCIDASTGRAHVERAEIR